MAGSQHFLVYFLIGQANMGLARVIMEATSARCASTECPVAPPECRAYVVKDDRGCPSRCDYSCGAPWCSLRTCPRACDNGYVKDIMGCYTCQCEYKCQSKSCVSDCPHGYERDKNNCPTCTCVSPAISCQIWTKCQRGYCLDSCKCQPDCYDPYPLPDNPSILAL